MKKKKKERERVTGIIVSEKNILHGGCGLSNMMEHSLEKWPECDEIFRDFFGFGGWKPTDEAARGMGRKKKTRFRSQFCKQEKR